VFVDAGYVWGDGGKVEFGDMRYSTGLAFSWSSPVGPLKFSLAAPLKKQTGDDIQRFQFQMGSVF
jgi:outer membrane protein insertion porin family